MEQLLSVGALTQILEGHKPANPVLQIIGYKPMTPDQLAMGSVTNELRYRLMIGDGVKSHQYCVITNQDIVKDISTGRLDKWSLIRVTSYQTADHDGPDSKRRLIYILGLELVMKGSEVGMKLSCQQPENPVASGRPPAQSFGIQAKVESPIRQRPPVYQPQSNFDAVTQPQMYQMNSNGAPPLQSPRSMRTNHREITEINCLSPYNNKWVIKGRVVSKSAIRTYNNKNGPGKLFSFNMTDKTGEIKVTAFNADCDRVFAYIEPNKVYILSRATVKPANKQFNPTADWEIMLNSDSLVEEEVGNSEDIPMAKFDFKSIATLKDVQPNQLVDVIGVITSLGDVGTIMSKTRNIELKKRNITILDMSRHTISVTIWGDQAETFEGNVDDIIVLKAARINSYGGRSASAGDCIFVNPNINEARKIKNWYVNLIDRNFTPLTLSQDAATSDQWKSLAELTDLNKAKEAENSNQPIYAKCKGTILSVGKNPVYKCCPKEGCGKKLVDQDDGLLKCEKCQQSYNETSKFRFMTNIEIGDATTSTWITLWDTNAELIFNMKPEQFEGYMRDPNKEIYEKVVNKPNFMVFIFTFRIRVDSYNNQERVKLNVITMQPINIQSYCKHLMDEIRTLGRSAV